MSTAIPSGMTFEMLSRLPPNSFVMEWREFRPDTQAPSRWGYPLDGAGSQRINFHLRGAPNEFLLNTDCYLSGEAWLNVINPQAGDNFNFYNVDGWYMFLQSMSGIFPFSTDLPTIPTKTMDNNFDRPGGLNSPYMYFQSSRESFNSGALPYLDNQDSQRSLDINTFRLLCSKSVAHNGQKAGLESCIAPWSFPLNGATNEGYRQWLLSGLYYYGPIFHQDGPPPVNLYGVLNYGGTKNFQIPLGLYSSLINSHSILPIGLFSSYSVNGYSIELNTNGQAVLPNRTFNAICDGSIKTVGWCNQKFWWKDDHPYPGASITHNTKTTIIYSNLNNNAWVRNLIIRSQVIKVLDPAVMEAVLSLYEKREMVNLGGVQFPLSLRLNSLGYRFYNQGIRAGQSEYHYRIPTTDRSVRAVAWIIQEPRMRDLGFMYNDSTLTCTRLSTKIGTEIIHPEVYDNDPFSNNVGNFINLNLKKCAGLFSAFPQYLEGKPRDVSMDVLNSINNTTAICTPNQYNDPIGIGDYVTAQRRSGGIVFCGAVSFENLDRREGDFQGSYQASGKDCSNVGSIEMTFRFLHTYSLPSSTPVSIAENQDVLASRLGLEPPTVPFDITFITVYDNVMECSPQGIMDITNAVL